MYIFEIHNEVGYFMYAHGLMTTPNTYISIFNFWLLKQKQTQVKCFIYMLYKIAQTALCNILTCLSYFLCPLITIIVFEIVFYSFPLIKMVVLIIT